MKTLKNILENEIDKAVFIKALTVVMYLIMSVGKIHIITKNPTDFLITAVIGLIAASTIRVTFVYNLLKGQKPMFSWLFLALSELCILLLVSPVDIFTYAITSHHLPVDFRVQMCTLGFCDVLSFIVSLLNLILNDTICFARKYVKRRKSLRRKISQSEFTVEREDNKKIIYEKEQKIKRLTKIAVKFNEKIPYAPFVISFIISPMLLKLITKLMS